MNCPCRRDLVAKLPENDDRFRGDVMVDVEARHARSGEGGSLDLDPSIDGSGVFSVVRHGRVYRLARNVPGLRDSIGVVSACPVGFHQDPDGNTGAADDRIARTRPMGVLLDVMRDQVGRDH